jgi:hypothetical protein
MGIPKNKRLQVYRPLFLHNIFQKCIDCVKPSKVRNDGVQGYGKVKVGLSFE